MPIELDLSVENTFPGNAAFAPALLDPDIEIPAGMVGPDGKPAPKPLFRLQKQCRCQFDGKRWEKPFHPSK